jgi:hypothetical protein
MTFPPFPFLICTQAQEGERLSCDVARHEEQSFSSVARSSSDYGPSVLMSDLEGPRLFSVIRWQRHSPNVSWLASSIPQI